VSRDLRDVETVAALEQLASAPGVPALIEAARDACVGLRLHQALRRRSAEARAEATVQAARSSAALAGAPLPLVLVRDVARGRAEFPDDASGRTARGVLRALAEADRLGRTWQQAPLQTLARLHTAACAGLVDDALLGRPRPAGDRPGDGTDLTGTAGGPLAAPDGEQLTGRLDALTGLLHAPESVPALLVAALVQAEVAVARPFAAGNGVVARALCRMVVIGRGLDPTGTVVWESPLLAAGPEYARGLSGYATGGPAGVLAWIGMFAEAVQAGAAQARRICDAVLAGRSPS
jgi:Fic family protein